MKTYMQVTHREVKKVFLLMQVYQTHSGRYKHYDKFHGRTLTPDSFKAMLHEFLHDGITFRVNLLQPIIERLSRLITQLQGLESYRFYASSLLIIYDGEIEVGSLFREQSSGRSCDSGCLGAAASSCDVIGSGCDGSLGTNSLMVENKCTVGKCSFDGNVNTYCVDGAQQVDALPSELDGHLAERHNRKCQCDCISYGENNSISNCVVEKSGCSSNGICNVTCNEPTNDIIPSKHISSYHISLGRRNVCISSDHSCTQSKTCSTSIEPPFSNIQVKQTTSSLHTSNPCLASSQASQNKQSKIDTPPSPKPHISLKENSAAAIVKACVELQEATMINYSSDLSSDDKGNNTKEPTESVNLDVKMIDFAHTTHRGFPQDKVKHQGPDLDYINGLTHLVRLFKELKQDHLKQ